MSDQNIIEKVQAILARANHPNTPQAEAETALALAQRLISKYALDESALADRPAEDTEVVRDHIDIRGAYALRRLFIAGVVAEANGVANYRSTLYKEGAQRYEKDGMRLHLFGTKADVFATKTIWSAVEVLMARTKPTGDRSYVTSWHIGFARGLRTVLKKGNAQAVQDSGNASGALVLASRFDRADKEMRVQVRGLRTVSSRGASNRAGASAGQSAGASFSTGGIGRGAIGALGR